MVCRVRPPTRLLFTAAVIRRFTAPLTCKHPWLRLKRVINPVSTALSSLIKCSHLGRNVTPTQPFSPQSAPCGMCVCCVVCGMRCRCICCALCGMRCVVCGVWCVVDRAKHRGTDMRNDYRQVGRVTQLAPKPATYSPDALRNACVCLKGLDTLGALSRIAKWSRRRIREGKSDIYSSLGYAPTDCLCAAIRFDC